MSTISSSLEENMANRPNSSYAVIITLRDDADIDRLGIDGKVIMPNTILSATLTKDEISKLSRNPDILAIENDEEIHTM